MDATRARSLLERERAQVQGLLNNLASEELQDQDADREGDRADSAKTLSADTLYNALADSLHDRLAAIDRAEQRLEDGVYGLSVRSGEPIPDERLEVMPTAELTVEEEEDGEASDQR